MDPISLLQVTLQGVMIGSIYVCVSLGLDVIVGVLGVITLAHGEFIMMGMYLSFFLFTLYSLPLYMVFVFVLLIFALASVPAYFGFFRTVMNKSLATQLFLTGGLSIVLANTAIVLWTATPQVLINRYQTESLAFGPILLNEALLVAFIVGGAAAVVGFLFLYKTERGAIVRAIMMNRELISFIGIAPEPVYMQGFLIGMLFTGVGSFLLALYYPLYPGVGQTYSLYMWASVILGGVGTVRGCFIGGLIIGLTQTISAFLFPANFQNIFVLCLFVIITSIRPTGILKGRL